MISYAQNREDVVLARLIGPVPHGRFVDVGAGHPVLDNVTYALYLAGWRGVNIEPMEREVELIREVRPEDETLQVAVGATTGRVTLFEAPLENRGATTSDSSLVEHYRSEGQEFRPFEVDVVPLSSVFESLPTGDVHVLKVDVEGMEPEVIAGANLEKIRPWVLVIEATVPNSKVDSAAAWEDEVLAAGYVQTLFDGLNRFYVRDDLPEIQKLLSVPANVFDDWVSVELGVCKEALRETTADFEARIREATAYSDALREDRDKAIAFATSLQEERERAAPHIVELQARSARVEQLELRVAELRRSLDEANREFGKQPGPSAG